MTNYRRAAIIFAALLLAVGILSIYSYWRGRRAGVIASHHQNTTHELKELDDEQEKVVGEVHALDTDSLRVHIMDLSRRVHEQAARVSK